MYLCNYSTVECSHQSIFIDNTTTCDIDYADSHFHLCKCVIVKYLVGCRSKRHMERNKVRGGDGLIERDQVHTDSTCSIGWSVRVVCNNMHSESFCTPCNFGTNFSESHHCQTELRCRLEIHVVNPNAGSPHHLQLPLGGFKNLASHLGPAPNNQGIAVGNLRAQIRRR
ncbi:hypothetical protein MIMGU_mgv1a015080mg [Erythranthe guttata]|uniref:Uncharacterized protein n=1 Tax=Erythranthe guttata TaxID=4155 RepID=A0A022S245_ERYGU|nr:hypothetical protein MIMGU_mgv1a015080mg [Erythranthe guttata]